MKEPLNNPKPAFIGKTFNQHPILQNLPLRLTKEQMKDPLLILEEFFQSYHLKDTRELMWNWLWAAITSEENDAHTRDNHLFFYEKLETLIEVAYILRRLMRKRRHRAEKRRLKKENQSKQDRSAGNPDTP